MEPLTPLPRLACKLKEAFGHSGPGYRKTYVLALDGRFPTVVRNGKLFVRDADLTVVADALGLPPAADHAVA